MGCINAMVHNHNIQFGKKLFVREILISEEGFTQNTRIGKKWEKLRKNTYRLAMHLEKPN
jgi:hypothetical protein